MTLPLVRILAIGFPEADLEKLRSILTEGESRFDLASPKGGAGELDAETAELLASDSCAVLLLGAPNPATARKRLRPLHSAYPSLPVVVISGDVADEDGDAPVLPTFEVARRALKREGARDVLQASLLSSDDACVLPGILAHLVENRRLVRELEKARELGLHLAHHDTLTGLPNRQLFRTRLRELLARARRHPRPLAVFFIDLDRFKQVNDTLGHNLGDLLLIEVGRRIRGCIRETDLVARRGGDEFTVILDGVADGPSAARVAQKIVDALREPLVLDGHRLRIGGSVGISLSPADGRDVEALVKCADIAMYRAKARGGGFEFFLPEMGQRTSRWLDLEHELRGGIDRGEFVLHYQPLVNIESGRIASLEALVRWNHPERGLVYPDAFIGVAEQSGLISELGHAVLLEACRQNREWKDRGLPIVPVAVNFSAKQFQTGNPVEGVREVLEETGLSSEYLDIELTESAIMRDPAFATDTLRRLRDLGLRIAIDDFGTGHSSLAYLKRFPITKLKIDRAFVSALMRDPKDAAICRAIISMAHNLQLKAVAEGVEETRQLEFLRHPGCDEVQGYLFAKPQDAERTERLLTGTSPLEATPISSAAASS
ncbi:MAG: EAL domain-containing protein [Planctomycetota bacterium]|nr:EAL domain-containing protein [Planctomycetota bacterium]